MKVVLLNQVETFLNSLDQKELAKAIRTIELLEEFGSDLSLPHSRHLSDGLLELRMRGKREVRIFYSFHKYDAYLLHGFIKKTQSTPEKELDRARAMQNHLHRL